MAAKDLQITRTRAIRVDDSLGSVNAPDGGGAGNSAGFILGIVRRQWPLLILAGIASCVIAWFVSLEFVTRTVTVELELKSQPLPVANQNMYVTPNPDVASEWLGSESVLQPVVDKHNLPPVRYFSRQLSIKSNVKSGSISLTLEHDDRKAALLILNDIADEFAKWVSQHRKETLTKHAEHFNSLRLDADRELSLARIEFVKLKDSERANGNELRQDAELQGFVIRKIEIEAAIEQTIRNRTKFQRNQRVLSEDIAAVQSAMCRDVLAGRQRQAESIGKGLSKSSRMAAVREEIQDELASLEKELVTLIPQVDTTSKTDQAPALDPSAVAGNPGPDATRSDDKKATVTVEPEILKVAAEVTALSANVAQANGVPAVEATPVDEEHLTKWIEKATLVGKETLGDLDPQTFATIQEARNTLAKFADEERKLQFDLLDNKEELESFEAKGRDLEVAMKGTQTKAMGQSSERAMELESELKYREQQYADLSRQWDQINQIKECQLPEYVVQRAASYVVDGEKSDRKKLFAFAFLGSGLVLLIPSAVFELLRMRPTPINVVSRRWNLPVLGVQPLANQAKTETRELAANSQHELRLMALRIQQSLFRPKGRVVLFSGLDHDESPMSLIRSLAKCFSQREESVLIIQTLPTPSEVSGAKFEHQHEQKSGRPGVAEFLNGEYEDAAELVVGTGFTGIAFLPGGCAVGASESMASSRLTSLIDQFRESYSMILLCGPSTLHPADLQMLAARADGIVFTVNKQSLHTVYGDEVIGDLIELGGPILGFAEQPSNRKRAFPGDGFQVDKETNGESSRTTTVTV